MKRSRWLVASCVAIAGAAASASAQFSGPYAPVNWTFNANGGDGSINLSAVPEAVTLVGNNNGIWNINTDYTVVAPASGLWSFSWEKFTTDTGKFDAAYYLLNGVEHFITNNQGPWTGSVQAVTVAAGDVIGFRLWSKDGALGALSLRVTNFNAPIPAPGAAAALLLPGLGFALRRSRRTRAAHPAV